MGKILVVTSGKGGSGKSTIAAGLGYALVQRGKSVLLIDTDAGLRSLDLILGTSANTVYDLGDVLEGSCEPYRAIQHVSYGEKFDLIPAPQTGNLPARPEDMVVLCRGLAQYYEYVIVDSPAGFGEGFRLAATAAQLALVVATPDPVCIRTAERAGRLGRSYGVEHSLLVINRYRPSLLQMGVVPDLDAVIDGTGLRLAAVIPDDDLVQLSASKGEPFCEKTPAATAFCNLASRLEGFEVPLMKL